MERDQHKAMNERFLATYDLYADGLYRFGLFRLSDKEAALDLVQDTFMRFWDLLTKETAIENERALLYTMARRLVIDRYRARRTVSLDNMVEETGFEPADEISASPERLAEQREVTALITKLPYAYQEAVLLRYVEGLEPRDIAQVLGESPNAVTVRLHRGVDKLKELMHEKNHD